MVIQKEDIPLYKEYLQGLTSEHLKDKTVPKEVQCSLLRENSKLTVKEILENPTNVENIQKSSKVVETIINGILDVENQFYNLLRITSDDFYAYTHSLNVCTLCIGLGLAINLKKETDIMELGLGALLHDIGKNMIAPYIINKPGRLTKEEFKTVQSHVVEGKDLLMRSNKKTPENVFIPILQHHEKLSGSGYPYGLKGPQIHPFGRITAIVNFYDTLITERPFKDAYKPFEALQLISESHEDYDPVLLKEFIAMLGQQKVSV
jgi:HD-GYP domain-containing protein (c-di-GMP phosphodiesterase class II)